MLDDFLILDEWFNHFSGLNDDGRALVGSKADGRVEFYTNAVRE